MTSLLRRLLLIAWLSRLTTGAAALPARNSSGHGGDGVPFITLEEHWLSPAFQSLYLTTEETELQGVRDRVPRLVEVGPERIAAMDEGGVAVQVVSHVSTSQRAMRMAAEIRTANDELHARVADPASRGRFRGFCALAMAFPDEAAAELRRCVAELGFVGALVDAHSVGDGGAGYYFYDSPAYDALWSALVELDVPIYLHPSYPPHDEMLRQGGLYAASVRGGSSRTPSYPDTYAVRLGTSTWGWHSNAGLSFLKLFAAGVFDRFPDLQVVLGHMGEMVPYYLDRVAARLQPEGRNITDVYAKNVYVTFGGYFSLAPMHTLLDVTDTSRIMYSVDYPFGNNTKGREFMEDLRASGLVSEEEYRDIAYRNAKRLLKI
ncbi:hypothetical protein RB595_010383 [Gaeumannomyces hyphopodioides]